MISVSTWTSQKSWQRLGNSSNDEGSMCGNLLQEQDFSFPIQQPKLFISINSAEFLQLLELSVHFPIFLRRAERSHSFPFLCFLQLSSIACQWPSSSKQKIWSLIQHWCFLVSVHFSLSFPCGSENTLRKRYLPSSSLRVYWQDWLLA